MTSSFAGMQTILTTFCNDNGLAIVIGLISGIQTHEQVQAFLATLRLIPSTPAHRLDELERSLEIRVRDMQIADLKAEVARLTAANQALETRLAARPAVPRPAPAPRPAAAARPADRRPSMVPVRLSPTTGIGKPGVKRVRKPPSGTPRKRSRPSPKPKPLPTPAAAAPPPAHDDTNSSDGSDPEDDGASTLRSTGAESL
jgi:hypothetical protein